jgi:hypothetical protein
MTVNTEFNFPKESFGYIPGAVPAKMVYSQFAPENPVEGLWWVETDANAIFTGRLFYWFGSWKSYGVSVDTISETQPNSPFPGMRWFHAIKLQVYVYFCNANGCQWLSEQQAVPPNVLTEEDLEPVADAVVNLVAESETKKSTFTFNLGATAADSLRAAMDNVAWLSPTTYGTHEGINGTASARGVFNFANFAGQTQTSSIPTGFIFHHYTDGVLCQMDNVGTGDLLVLKNARNPTRRPDKESSFVGTGVFIKFVRDNFSLGYSQTLGYISNLFDIVWTGVSGIASLWQNKADDSTYGFQFKYTNHHRYLLRFVSDLVAPVTVASFENDVSYTRFAIKTQLLSGMLLEASAGPLFLSGTEVRPTAPIRANTGNLVLGALQVNKAVETQVPLLIRNYNNASQLPLATDYPIALAMCAGVLVYSNAGVWKYVADNTTVV